MHTNYTCTKARHALAKQAWVVWKYQHTQEVYMIKAIKTWSFKGNTTKKRSEISTKKNRWCKKSSSQELKSSGWKRCEIKLGGQGLLLLMKLKFLIMMTRPQNVLFLSECFAALSSLSKILISSTAGGLGRPIWFHIFFILNFLVFGRYFFTPAVFWLRLNLLGQIPLNCMVDLLHVQALAS